MSYSEALIRGGAHGKLAESQTDMLAHHDETLAPMSISNPPTVVPVQSASEDQSGSRFGSFNAINLNLASISVASFRCVVAWSRIPICAS